MWSEFGLVALVFQQFIEHFKTQFSFLHGQVINLITYAAGIGWAWGAGLDVFGYPNETFSKILTGLALGTTSSVIYETVGKLKR